MHKKRMVLTSEPDDDAKLRMSLIKDLTGAAVINARQLYKGDCEVHMNMVLLLECNQRPAMSGRKDESVMERVIDIPFKSFFTADKMQWSDENHIYPVNTAYKTTEFQQTHKCALFDYIMENAPQEMEAPDVVKNASREYVIDSDTFWTWFEDHFEPTGKETDVLDMKYVHSFYMDSHPPSETKLYSTQKKFKQLLQASCAFKGIFFTDSKRIEGKKYTNRFVGYIGRVDGDGIEEDEGS
jgi:phage/plasmid-associated DNA primase